VRRTLALGACLVLAACALPLDPPPAGPPGGDQAARHGGVLRLVAGEDPRTLDPAKGYDAVSWTFEQMLFATLLDYGDGTELAPELATAWQVSPDGRRVVLQLRSGVRFTSGRPFTGADVKYSIERLLSPRLRSLGAEFFRDVEGAAAFVDGTAAGVAGVVVPAPDVVEFHLRGPDPLFLHKLAMPFAAVVDRDAAEGKTSEEFSRRPSGLGAFVLEEWVFGQRLRLARNPAYFRTGLPYVDAVDVIIGVSDQLGWLKYQHGEVDLSGIPSAEFNRVVHDARYRPLLLERTTLRTYYIGLNCEVPPFDRRAVRQALNFAVDKGRVVELLDGRALEAAGVLPPEMPGWARRPARYPHDPAAARARLAAAGLGAGFRTVLWTVKDETAQRIAQSAQQDLAAVGIDVRIKLVDFPALVEAVRVPGEVALFFLAWEADFPDPSNFLRTLLHSRNRGTNNNTFYANPAVDRLLDAAEPVLDLSRRFALFQKAERLIVEDAPWVPLFHPVAISVRHPRVRGLRLHPLRPTRYETTWLAW
jgi:ABC-type transport system substrate-binding protein